MRVAGTTNSPITKPMMMIVEDIASLPPLLLIWIANESRKQIPQIKASLDKNNSQRIGDFRLK